MRAKIIFYNEKTGEVYEEIERVLFIGKKAFIRDRNFVKVFVGFLSDILEDRELGTGAWRLLVYAINNIDYNSLRVSMVPDEVAQELGITKRTFYRWLSILLRKKYLEKVATNIYRIRPYSAIRGHMELATKGEPDF